jgi:hypothetical protein
MASKISFGNLVGIALLSGILATSAQAQFYGMPYGYPYGPESDAYPPVPPPSAYPTPGFSYDGNPYAPFLGPFSYEMPQNAYGPTAYTYDLQANGYGYPPPIVTPPLYPNSYYPDYTPDLNLQRRGLPGYWRGVYRELSLPEYLVLQLHGPVRVRDIVPGVPGLGG